MVGVNEGINDFPEELRESVQQIESDSLRGELVSALNIPQNVAATNSIAKQISYFAQKGNEKIIDEILDFIEDDDLLVSLYPYFIRAKILLNNYDDALNLFKEFISYSLNDELLNERASLYNGFVEIDLKNGYFLDALDMISDYPFEDAEQYFGRFVVDSGLTNLALIDDGGNIIVNEIELIKYILSKSIEINGISETVKFTNSIDDIDLDDLQEMEVYVEDGFQLVDDNEYSYEYGIKQIFIKILIDVLIEKGEMEGVSGLFKSLDFDILFESADKHYTDYVIDIIKKIIKIDSNIASELFLDRFKNKRLGFNILKMFLKENIELDNSNFLSILDDNIAWARGFDLDKSILEYSLIKFLSFDDDVNAVNILYRMSNPDSIIKSIIKILDYFKSKGDNEKIENMIGNLKELFFNKIFIRKFSPDQIRIIEELDYNIL